MGSLKEEKEEEQLVEERKKKKKKNLLKLIFFYNSLSKEYTSDALCYCSSMQQIIAVESF